MKARHDLGNNQQGDCTQNPVQQQSKHSFSF
jgi:hypothetical protein